jgi:phage baseplate assembly protein W
VSGDNNKHLAFPFRIGSNGKPVQTTSIKEHVEDELIQMLLTNPGERFYLPEFGGGLNRLLFSIADDSTSLMTKALITQAISTWLGDRIVLEDITAFSENETIKVNIKYRIIGFDELNTLTLG